MVKWYVFIIFLALFAIQQEVEAAAGILDNNNTVVVRVTNERDEPVDNAWVRLEMREPGIRGYYPYHVALQHTRNGIYQGLSSEPSGGTIEIYLRIDAPGYQTYRRMLTQSGSVRSSYGVQLSTLGTDKTDQDFIQHDGKYITLLRGNMNMPTSSVRVTSNTGIAIENAHVLLNYEQSIAATGTAIPPQLISLEHKTAGTYSSPSEPSFVDGPYDVSLIVMAEDHASYNNLLSRNFQGPVNAQIELYHDNYYDRCRGLLRGQQHTYPDSPWNDCQVDANRLIESFGIEQRDIRYTITNRTSTYPVFKFAPDTDHAIESIEIYAARKNAYETILEQLFRGTALNMATAQSQELSQWVTQHMRTHDDLSRATLSAQGAQLITGFTETLQAFGEAFEIIGATLDLERAFRQGSMDGVLMYLAYESTAGDILDRMELMIRQSDSWLANDEALKYALRDIRFEFDQNRNKNMEQMARAVGNNTVTETVGDILLSMALKTALSHAGITVASLVTGKAAPAVLAGSVKVVVAVVIFDFIQSSLRTHRQRSLMATALQLDRYLLEGVPDRFEASLVPRLRDEDLTGMLIRLQLGLLYNEARAAMFSGELRTRIGYQLQYSDSGPRNQNQAYELRMAAVSREKSARAEADLAQLVEEIFRRQKLQQVVEKRSYTLDICDTWTVANSGGVEGTIDTWDISILPPDVMLDVRFNMFRIPDQLVMEYPLQNIVLDTGWRGANSFNRNPNYPGGIQGAGQGEYLNVFQKDEIEEFIVRVNGVDSGTRWEYRVRCRVP